MIWKRPEHEKSDPFIGSVRLDSVPTILAKTLSPNPSSHRTLHLHNPAMALSHLLRRAATTAAPLVSRAARRSTASCSALRFPAAGHSTGGRRFFASEAKPSSDKDLLKIIQSEIQCAKESNDPNQVMFLMPQQSLLVSFEFPIC